MAKKGVFALLTCVFALCLALVGCGGTGNSADNKAAFTGTWDLVEMNQDGQVTGSDDLETLKSLGLEVYVNLNEDGTAALVLFGEAMEGTWEATSATAGTITLEGQQVNMAIEDSKLTFEQEGASLTFEKGEAKEVPTSSDASESATAESESAEGEAVEGEAAETESVEGEAAESEAAEATEETPESESAESAEGESEASSSSSAAA